MPPRPNTNGQRGSSGNSAMIASACRLNGTSCRARSCRARRQQSTAPGRGRARPMPGRRLRFACAGQHQQPDDRVMAVRSAVARQIAASSSGVSTRSRDASSPLTVPTTGLASTRPARIAQANAADRFARARLAPTVPAGARQLEQPGGYVTPSHVGRRQAVQRRPMAFERALGLDQGPRPLVPLGVVAQIGVDQIANSEHLGRRRARLLALHRRVAAVASGIEDLGRLPTSGVQIKPRDWPQGDPLPLAVRRGEPGDESEDRRSVGS